MTKTINLAHATVLIGNSKIKNIGVLKLGKEVGKRVVVKSFPGCTAKDTERRLKRHLIY